MIDTNEVIRVSSKERGSIGGPRQAEARGNLSRFRFFGTERVDDNLAFEVPNLDTVICGGAEPVTIGRKDERVNNLAGIQGIETFAFVQVPKHGSAILATRSTEGAIRRNTDSVEVPSVSHKVIAEFAVGERKDLDETIPATTDNEGDALGRRKAYTRHPLSMSLAFSRSNSVFALSKSVPELDGLVARARDNLTVVHRKGHA